MGIAISVHVIAAAIWVGGMFFAYVALRPSMIALESGALRFDLWQRVLGRFFRIVWVCIAALFASGYWMVYTLGGMDRLGSYVYLMQALGIFMVLLALHVYFAPFRRFGQALSSQDWEAATGRLQQIRMIVAINIALGFAVLVIGASGQFW
jgi:uncharacterized membrane protein